MAENLSHVSNPTQAFNVGEGERTLTEQNFEPASNTSRSTN